MTLIVAEEAGILRLTLNRPEKRNALNISLLKELLQALKNPSARVLILEGAGPVFCAGMDLQEAGEKEIPDLIRQVLLSLYRSPLVTIAAVQGAALAGGAGLLAACDFVFATPEAKIGFPEVRRGLIAAQVAVFLLRRISPSAVKELLLLGNMVEAKRAARMGLVNWVAPDVGSAALQLAEEVKQGGKEAIKATKKLLETLADHSLEHDLDVAMAYSKRVQDSPEAVEGVRAFLEKRKPNW